VVGNNVGCQNWDNFWLNEGINTFMERKVLSVLRGENFEKIDYFTGNTSMYFGDMLSYGLDDSYSSVFPDIGDDDPENSFYSPTKRVLSLCTILNL
jgi:leukotriene-A4 hydrolase